MKVSAAFPSTYLKGTDLLGRTAKVPIDRVEIENVGADKSETKPVIYFIGKEKGMVCNKTNMNELVAALGDDEIPCPSWHGRVIEVFFDPSIMYAGKRTGGLRVRVPAQPQVNRPAPSRPAPPPEEPGSNDQVNDDPYNEDDIPF